MDSARMHHQVTALAHISTHSGHFKAGVDLVLPIDLRVVGISALVRPVLLETADIPLPFKSGSRADLIISLLVQEIAHDAMSASLAACLVQIAMFDCDTSSPRVTCCAHKQSGYA